MSDFIERNLPKLFQSIEEATPQKMLGAQPTPEAGPHVPCVLCGAELASLLDLPLTIVTIGICSRCENNLDAESREAVFEFCQRVMIQAQQRMEMILDQIWATHRVGLSVMQERLNRQGSELAKAQLEAKTWKDLARHASRRWKRLAWVCVALLAALLAGGIILWA